MSPKDAFHEAAERYIVRGKSGGQTVVCVRLLKEFPKARAIVSDISTLDILVAMGVQPSQIMVSSEFKNTSRFDMLEGVME
jgi:hypothetical protein